MEDNKATSQTSAEITNSTSILEQTNTAKKGRPFWIGVASFIGLLLLVQLILMWLVGHYFIAPHGTTDAEIKSAFGLTWPDGITLVHARATRVWPAVVAKYEVTPSAASELLHSHGFVTITNQIEAEKIGEKLDSMAHHVAANAKWWDPQLTAGVDKWYEQRDSYLPEGSSMTLPYHRWIFAVLAQKSDGTYLYVYAFVDA